MKRFTSLVILLGSLLSFIGCGNKEHLDYKPQTETGSLQLKMSLSVSITTTNPASRASIDTKDFFVTIYDAKTGSIAQDVNKTDAVYQYSSMPEIITLYTGDYYIVASSQKTMPAAEWETPYYEGRSEVFTIKKAAVTQVSDIICSQQNVKVTVSYTDKLKKELTSYYATISLSSSSSDYLVFQAETTQSGYFKPEKLKAILNGTRYDGEVVSAMIEIDSVQPGQHQNIEFDVILSGTLQFAIGINTDTDVIDKDIIVPPSDSTTIVDPDPTPDPDPEPEPEDVITIVGQGFNIDEAIEFAVGETKTVVVDIQATNQIYDLWVEINSPFLTEEELGNLSLPIPKKFNLGNLSPELKQAFGPEGLGLIGNEDVRGKNTLVFDITRFTSLLLQAGTHKFIVTVNDYDGISLQKTLTLVNH